MQFYNRKLRYTHLLKSGDLVRWYAKDDGTGRCRIWDIVPRLISYTEMLLWMKCFLSECRAREELSTQRVVITSSTAWLSSLVNSAHCKSQLMDAHAGGKAAPAPSHYHIPLDDASVYLYGICSICTTVSYALKITAYTPPYKRLRQS